MPTPKITTAETLLRRRAFYLRIPRDILRAAQARTLPQPVLPPATSAPDPPPKPTAARSTPAEPQVPDSRD